MRRMDSVIDDLISRHRKGRQGFSVFSSSALSDAAKQANAGYGVVDMPEIRRAPQEQGGGWGEILGSAIGGAGAGFGRKLFDKKDDAPMPQPGGAMEFPDNPNRSGGAMDFSDNPYNRKQSFDWRKQVAETPMNIMPGEEGGIPTGSKASASYQKLRELFDRDYKKGGKDYDKDHDWKDILKGIGIQAAQGIASAPRGSSMKEMLGRGLGGAIGGGVATAMDRNADNKMLDEIKIARELPKYQAEYEIEQRREADAQKKRRAEKDIENIDLDNQLGRDRLAEMGKDRERKEGDRVSRERTARMRTVAGMLKDLPEFIPGDPKFKEIEDALGDAQLPITQKDAKKKVDLKQDQRTGEWSIIVTNPVTGIAEDARPIMKDGKPFKSTPTVVMQGEYGLLRQDDQQEHATSMETLRQQGRETLARLQNELITNRQMSTEERKRKEKQVTDLKLLIGAGEGVPNQ